MKKYIKIGIVLYVIFALIPQLKLTAQNTIKIDINAVVINSDGEPIENASISNEKEPVQAITDDSGNFSINAIVNTYLRIEAPGFKIAYVEVLPNLKVVTLQVDYDDHSVQTAFKRVHENHLFGDVSKVDVAELLNKNYFTYGLDGMSAFIGGYNNNLWGMNEYLLLIDGVPGDITTISPTEIKEISFMKGVQTIALYGSRAAKGVVYVTTKRGESKKQNIKVRANTGVFVPKSYPEYLSSSEYMELYNEANLNDGRRIQYDEETIENHSSGINPYRYPNTDYYSSEYLKEYYNRHDVTAEISGGGNKARYYTNLGFSTEGSLLNFGEAVNSRNDRFNIRGNIDMDLNDFLSCRVDAAAIFYNARGVNTDYWQAVSALRPHRIAPLIPISSLDTTLQNSEIVLNSNNKINGQYLLGGTQQDLTNPVADIYAGGYNKYVNRQFKFNTGIDADLSKLTKGLSFHTTFGVDYSTSYNLGYNNAYSVFQPNWKTDDDGNDINTGLTMYGAESISGRLEVNGSYYRQTIAFSGMLNYDRRFGNDHQVSGMLLANGYQQSESGVYHKVSNANLGIQLGYNFQNKYAVNFNGAVVHSAKLPDGNRQAISPTISLAWTLSEEDFLSDISAIDHIKMYASAGILNTDLDIEDFYLYKGIYTSGEGTWYSWRDGALVQSYDSRRGENPALTYPKRKEINAGIEGSMFEKLITFNSSFFINQITGNIIMAEVLYPSYFRTYWPNSSFIPYSNYDIDQRVGVDFSANFNKNIGDFFCSLGVNGTYYDTKAILREENYENDYQYRQGKPLDGHWGLESLGFFSSEEEISNAPAQSFGTVQPGDLQYKDQNDDGVIDTEDEVFLAKAGWSGAPLTVGVNLTLKWKNFTFFALGIGRYGAYSMKNGSYYWVDGDDKYSAVVRNRWTEESKETATYPRLTSRASNNNFRNSDFWLYSTNRFDIGKVQLSYDLPEDLMKGTFIQQLGVYMSASNLYTFSKERETLELNVGRAPQTRFFNLGVKALF